MFIETWRASRGFRRERLHSFMCNAFGPGGVRAQRPDARRHRSPRRNGGCVAIQGDSALRHGHVKKTGQWCTQNRATDPGVALLGDPGRVGEKGREGLQVGLQVRETDHMRCRSRTGRPRRRAKLCGPHPASAPGARQIGREGRRIRIVTCALQATPHRTTWRSCPVRGDALRRRR